MNKIVILAVLAAATFFTSCKRDKVSPDVGVTFKFSHTVGDQALETKNIKYTNEAGNQYSVVKLQYVISDIRLSAEDGSELLIDEYHFVDIKDEETFEFKPTELVTAGEYSSMSFVFGLAPSKNITGAHKDLNLQSWGWPDESSGTANLGGGYHFMKLEGKFINTTSQERSYATHMGTAREITATDTLFHENHINIDLSGTAIPVDDQTSIEIKMDIAEWYTNPTTLNMNSYNGSVMPNFEVQKTLNANGASAFSLGTIE